MIIREAEIDDIKQIQRVRNFFTVNRLSDPNFVTDKNCEEFIIVRGKGWECETDNQIVGFSIADLKDNNIKALFLQLLTCARFVVYLLALAMLMPYLYQKLLSQ